MLPIRPHFLALAVLLLGPVPAAHAGSSQALVEARHALQVSEQVLERLELQVAAARRDPATGPGERRRLTEYLAYVRSLVATNREHVRTLERAQRGGGSIDARTGIAPEPVTTEADEIEALEEDLDASLSEFDELLLEEARRAREEAADDTDLGGMAGTGSAGGGAGGGASGAEQAASQADKGLESTSGPDQAGEDDGQQEPVAGEGAPGEQEQAASRVPPDVGDGSDDDVVARQIRKAAESEPDPELRERLWEEYRKYKEGNRG